jgi:hypothetical protein
LAIPQVRKSFKNRSVSQPAVRAGLVDLKAAALDNSAWPPDVLKVSNNIANQFQLPVLFHVVCIQFALAGTVEPVVVGIAWAFVASRIAHSVVHVTTNYVPLRMPIFAAGTLLLAGLVVVLGLSLLLI